MNGQIISIQHRLNKQLKRLAIRHHAHITIFFKHREFLWL
jgi:hypothetical protein